MLLEIFDKKWRASDALWNIDRVPYSTRDSELAIGGVHISELSIGIPRSKASQHAMEKFSYQLLGNTSHPILSKKISFSDLFCQPKNSMFGCSVAKFSISEF